MPPLPGATAAPAPSLVPVVTRAPSSSPYKGKGNLAVRDPPRRQYGDDPLPIKPNDIASRDARIVHREQDHDGGLVRYTLKVGEVEINDVGVDEILDYVSALELERFEMIKFKEEAEILTVLRQDREIARREKLARAAEKARMRGVASHQEESDSDVISEVPLGKHGRARPDYSKFYEKPRGSGKSFFEDMDDEDMAHASMQTHAERPAEPRSTSACKDTAPLQELSKRRRRRRDPQTGELMPLEPIVQPPLGIEKTVRRRRKRHPLTGELMPIGWRFDRKTEENAFEKRRDGLGPAMKLTALEDLTLADQRGAKRPRLDTESARSSSASPMPTKVEIMAQASSQQQSTPRGLLKQPVVDLVTSESEPEIAVASPSSTMKSRPKQAGNSMMRGTITSAATTSADESSPEPNAQTSITRPSAQSPSASQRTPKASQTTTSIVSPSAARTSTNHADQSDGEDDSSEDEWEIEAIIGHQMSNPKTHPPELGKAPIMLYRVKWEGYPEATWEPVESFGDRSTVDEYRKRTGLKPLPATDTDAEDELARHSKPALSGTAT